MKVEWLIKDNLGSLIIFCNGWGMDQYPFRPLTSIKYDVLVVFNYESGDYEDLVDIQNLLQEYEEIILIGWSMGVYFGQKYFKQYQKYFKKIIAVNGTLSPVDDLLGIPESVFSATLNAMSEETILKFYKRMCRSKKVFNEFLKNKPRRTIEDQRLELHSLLENKKSLSENCSIYSDILISKKDFIMPTENQQRFWQNGNVKIIEGYHFPFYNYNSWDELAACDVS